MIITAKYGLHHFTGYGEMQFNHFPIISLWKLSIDMQPSQEAISIILASFTPPTQAPFLPNFRLIVLTDKWTDKKWPL